MASKVDVVYARYSSHQQDDSTSIEVQLESCQRAAGKTLVQYIDRAKTGRTMGGRTELLQLIHDAEEGRVETLYVYKFDRLGRAAETHVLIEDLERFGVKVVSATEGTNSLARGVQLVVAADFSRALAERTRAGLIKRHQAGYHTGGPAPYGYHVVTTPDGKNKLAIDEDEAGVVRWIFHQYLDHGHDLKIIGQRLEQRGVKTRLGGHWRFTTIRGIITNRMLVGEIVYLRRTFKLNRSTGKRIPQANDPATHKVQVDPMLRIVDDPTFAQAQAKLAENRRDYMPRPRNQVRAFTRMLFCSECGSVCYARKSKNAKGEYYYYGCGCRQTQGSQACINASYIREDLLKNKVMLALGDLFVDAEAMIAEAVGLAERQIATHREEASRLKAEISLLDDQINGYLPLLLDRDLESLAKKAIGQRIATAQARQDQLRAALETVTERAGQNAADLVAACREAFREARDVFTVIASDSQFNHFVEATVGPMLLLPDGSIAQKEATTVSDGRWAGSVVCTERYTNMVCLFRREATSSYRNSTGKMSTRRALAA